MQYAPTACRIKCTAIHPNHDHRQSLIYTEKPRLQTSFSHIEENQLHPENQHIQ